MTSINFHAVDANGPFIPFHRLSANRFCNDSLTPFCKVHVDRVTPGAGISFPTAATVPMLAERVELWFFVRSRQKNHKIVPAGLLIPAAHRRCLAPPAKKGMQLHPRPRFYSIHILPAACPTVYLRIPVLHRSSSRCPS